MAAKKKGATKRNTIGRVYKGKTLSVQPVKDGFRFRGKTYRSLTAVAREVTGAKAISGPFFFGLTKRKPRGGGR